MKLQSLLSVWALAAVAACGSVSSKPDAGEGSGSDAAPPGDFSLAVDPGTLTLSIAGTGTAAVNVSRGAGFTEAVALSAAGAPAGVTVAFDLASLPDGTATTNLTVTVDATAVAGTTDITVTGTAGAVTRDATLSLTLTTATVTGLVRGGTANVTVRLVGKSAVVTDSAGMFTFTDVVLPYDIYAIGVEGVFGLSSINAVNYYKGLTRTDPVLTRPSQTSFFNILQGSGGSIQGARSGGNLGLPMLMFWSTGGAAMLQPANVAGYNSVQARWGLTASTTGTFYGIQIARGTAGAPTGYPGYAAVPATVTQNVATTIDLPLAAATSAAVTGTITQPTSFPLPTLTMTQRFGTRNEVLWTTATQAATSAIPLIAAGTTSFHATSTMNGSTSQVVFPGLAAATDVTFALPPPAVMTGPVNGATNVTATTPFEFTTTAGSVYKVSMTSGAANFHVFTTSGSVTLPTVPTVSELPLPSNTMFTWTVAGFGPAVDANGAADPVALEGVSTADFDGAMHFQTTIPNRTFTSQ